MKIVMFDDKDEYTLIQKQNHLIKCVLKRLVDYQMCDIRFISDDDNPIIRAKIKSAFLQIRRFL